MSDEWGQDPSVRFMRRVFRQMEAVQQEIIERAKISPFDPRLRLWRNEARERFERCWALAARRGADLNEKDAGPLYAACLSELLRKQGIAGSDQGVSDDPAILNLIREVTS